ncbi:hypothetical protein J1N10_01205 [Carboxylicivirga sp. A043]|uniref:hypothetical protein n=1 Tax=Carboxylicivirga litoralis TaxID=2816963 RepID=UPI0021CB4A5D|nr:hypothetical protein [Carboxylicivirga sp. A043]MCU4154572.1 hypothetical protein [Carboxylicivirga sp. A043]
MNRKGIITLVFGLCVSCLVGCSDSDVPSDKDLLSESLKNGSWQVSLQHALTRNSIDITEVQLQFSEVGMVNAQSRADLSEMWNAYNGAYSLFYDSDDDYDPDYDDLDDNYDREKNEDLYVSLAFGKSALIVLNDRWRVQRFSSSLVVLRADDMALTLSKEEAQ